MTQKWMSIAAALILAAGVAAAQTEEPAVDSAAEAVGGLPFAGEIDVTVVNVNVYVTDKQGRAVTDLKPEDFAVTMDGVQRPVSNFDLFTQELYRSFYMADSPPTGMPTPTPVPALPHPSGTSPFGRTPQTGDY